MVNLSTVPTNPAPGALGQRLLSLDALRGFTLMWIVGADAFGTAFSHLDAGPWFKPFAAQFEHVAWSGFHFYDLIFPLFVFMIGVSITYSLGRIALRDGRGAELRRVFRRALIMYLLGLFYYGGLSTPLAEIRWLGVLQRLALCYFFTSILFIYFRPKVLVAVFACLLIGYWALLTFVPVPGWGAGDFSEGHNLTNWIDQHFLAGKRWDGDHDPEGILSTLPAIASCLLGLFGGLVLKDSRTSERSKTGILFCSGIALIVVGYFWGFQFPVIKRLWTSSYVSVAGGWSAVLLGAFYYVIDVLGVRAWATPFVWLGTNALTLYVLSHIINFWNVSERIFGGPIEAFLNRRWIGSGEVLLALASVACCMAIGRFFYVRRIFLRL